MPRLARLLQAISLVIVLDVSIGCAQAQQAPTGVGANVSTTAPRPTLVNPISRCLIFTGITRDKCFASEKAPKPQPRARRTAARP